MGNIRRDSWWTRWRKQRKIDGGLPLPVDVDRLGPSYTSQAQGDVFSAVGAGLRAMKPAFSRAAGNAARLEQARNRRDELRGHTKALRQSAYEKNALLIPAWVVLAFFVFRLELAFGEWLVASLDADGELDTSAGNATSRARAFEEIEAQLEAAITEVFDDAPSLDDGRDSIGALERAGRNDPVEVVLCSTSGGVHRTADVNFLHDVPAAEALNINGSTGISLHGIGDVPVPEGEVPSRDFTQSLHSFWDGVCDLHNGKCDVR